MTTFTIAKLLSSPSYARQESQSQADRDKVKQDLTTALEKARGHVNKLEGPARAEGFRMIYEAEQELSAASKACINLKDFTNVTNDISEKLTSIPKLLPVSREHAKSLLSSLHEKIAKANPSARETIKTTLDVGISVSVGIGVGKAAGMIQEHRIQKAEARAFELVNKSNQANFNADQAKIAQDLAEKDKLKERKEYRRAKSQHQTVKARTDNPTSSLGKWRENSLPTLKDNAHRAKKAWKDSIQVIKQATEVAEKASKIATEAGNAAAKACASATNKVTPQVLQYGTGALVAGTVFCALRLVSAPVNMALNSTPLGNADLPMKFDEPAQPRSHQPAPNAPEKEVASATSAREPAWTEPGLMHGLTHPQLKNSVD